MQDQKARDQMRVVYQLPHMEQIPVYTDIIYKTIHSKDLKMDIYYPFDRSPDSILPAMIFVRGGSSQEQVKRMREASQYVSWCQLVAASGLIAVMFEHRSDEGFTKLSEAGSDVNDLFSFIHTHGRDLGINPHALGVWTCSDGSLYGVSAALRGTPTYIRCIIAYYGGMTLLNHKYFHFCSEEEDAARTYSPAYHLGREDPANIPPLFIAKAGKDKAFLNEILDEFVTRANERNIPLTFMNHPMGEHGFDIFNDDARTREIIKATLAFALEHLE